MWVFGFGSLMWDNWETKYNGTKIDRAILKDFRRSFNKSSLVNWGSRSNGCPTLGLEPEEGSECMGAAFKFQDELRDEILTMLRKREGTSFELKELNITLPDSTEVSAITPVNRHDAKTYIGKITLENRAEMAKEAKGKDGLCIDYIKNIRQKLKALSIDDPNVEKFYDLLINSTEPDNFIDYYHLEQYLFETVSTRFRKEKRLKAFDFFCIIIWKANRAKSKVAERLLRGNHKTIESAVIDLTTAIAKKTSDKERMALLINDWGFRLPMASAILTVLYPERYTVYDIRVCDSIDDFHKIQNKKFESLWEGYQDFLKTVEKKVSKELTLRDKDRWLWGQSFAEQLQTDIKANFNKGTNRK